MKNKTIITIAGRKERGFSKWIKIFFMGFTITWENKIVKKKVI